MSSVAPRKPPAAGAGAERIPHVLIVGGGFAGLYAARALRRAPVRVTLVDRRNHHLFQPLLYQVATAGLSAPDVAEPIRRILRRQRNVTVLLGEVERVEPEARAVVVDGERLGYDALVLAPGATHDYFGHEEWAADAPGLKSVEDAFEIRRRMLLAFEAAERESDPERRRRHLTFAIVGAGPTGVELAGAIREIAQRTLAHDFRNFRPEETRVVLLDAADRVLPTFPERLSGPARRLLEARGVEVKTGALVTALDAHGVTAGGERIEARTTLWAAGVRASPLARTLGTELLKDGRVPVRPDLSVPGHPEIFVAGDLAAVWREDGRPVPGMAPAAIQEGRCAAQNAARLVAGRETAPFRYTDRGMLATVGRRAGVAVVRGVHFTGFAAWLVWLAVHLFWLVGFRNRLVVLFEWGWSYFTYQRSARVIVGPPGDPRPPWKEGEGGGRALREESA